VSIRPNVIDGNGQRPCLPGFYSVAKRMAEGRTPSLTERIAKALATLRKRIAR
jgi:hypothetical protein